MILVDAHLSFTQISPKGTSFDVDVAVLRCDLCSKEGTFLELTKLDCDAEKVKQYRENQAKRKRERLERLWPRPQSN